MNDETKDMVIDRSVPRLKNYLHMNTQKIDVSNITPIEAAKLIFKQVLA